MLTAGTPNPAHQEATARLGPTAAGRAPDDAGYVIVRCLSGPQPERRARRVVTDVLAAAGVQAGLPDVELAVNELVANARQHAPGPYELRIVFEPASVKVAVVDGGTEQVWITTGCPARPGPSRSVDDDRVRCPFWENVTASGDGSGVGDSGREMAGVSAGGPGAGGWSADDDACWQEAARLRREYPQWIIIWLASVQQYRAYRRMPGARRDTALTAPTSGELAAKIAAAGQPSLPAPRDGDDQP